MLLIPAIDLKNGKCVRLRQGRMEDETIFSDNPVAIAETLVAQGAERLHLVDLDGAFAGKPKNSTIIHSIVKNFPEVIVQVGGGIRNKHNIQNYLDVGVQYVVIGTKAINNPDFVSNMVVEFPKHIIISLDTKNGKVATEGWSKLSQHNAIDLAQQFESNKVEAIIYTDISRDGMLNGINIKDTVKLAKAIKIPLIASGGITDISDIHALGKVAKNGITGVISGRAIYEASLNFIEAKKIAAGYG